jgi:hypothetical protein
MKSLPLLVLLALCACQPGDPNELASDDTTTDQAIVTEEPTLIEDGVVFDENSQQLVADESAQQPEPKPAVEPQPIESNCECAAEPCHCKSHGLLGLGIVDGDGKVFEGKVRRRMRCAVENRPRLLNGCRSGLFR